MHTIVSMDKSLSLHTRNKTAVGVMWVMARVLQNEIYSIHHPKNG